MRSKQQNSSLGKSVRELSSNKLLLLSRQCYRAVWRPLYKTSEKSYQWFVWLSYMDCEGINLTPKGIMSYSGYNGKCSEFCFSQLSKYGLVECGGVNGSTVYSLTAKGRELFDRILEFERDYLAGL